MSTLAADKVRVFEQDLNPQLGHLPIIAADTVYRGSAVGDNGSGYGRPLVSGDPFRGFAEAQCANESGAAGALNIFLRQQGVIQLAVTGASAVTDIGAPVFATDDDTYTLSPGGSLVGTVKKWLTGTTCLVAYRANQVDPRQPIAVTFGWNAPADTTFFTADRAYKVVKVTTRVDTAGTDGGAVTAAVKKAPSGTALASGTALHASTINLKGTAATNQSLTLSSTLTDLDIAAGDSIGLDVTGTPTAAVGSVTVFLLPK